MHLSNAEDEGDTELQVSEQQQKVGRSYTCGSTKHLRPTCPLSKQRQITMSQNPGPYQKPGMDRGNVDTQ